MEKEQNTNSENQNKEAEEIKTEEAINEAQPDDVSETKEEIKEPTPEEKVKELEDKVARTLAEMENQ